MSRKPLKAVFVIAAIGCIALAVYIVSTIDDPDNVTHGATNKGVASGTVLAALAPDGTAIKGTYTLIKDAQVLTGNRGIQLSQNRPNSTGAMTYNFNPGPAWILSMIDRGQGDVLYMSAYHRLSEVGWGLHLFSGYRFEFRRDWKKVTIGFAGQILASADDVVTDDSPLRISVVFDHGLITLYRGANQLLRYQDSNFEVHSSPQNPDTFFEIGAANIDSSDTRIVSGILLKVL
jgi:hypothetical protein